PAAPRHHLHPRHGVYALGGNHGRARPRAATGARRGGRARLRATRDRGRAGAGQGTRTPEPFCPRATPAADGWVVGARERIDHPRAKMMPCLLVGPACSARGFGTSFPAFIIMPD